MKTDTLNSASADRAKDLSTRVVPLLPAKKVSKASTESIGILDGVKFNNLPLDVFSWISTKRVAYVEGFRKITALPNGCAPFLHFCRDLAARMPNEVAFRGCLNMTRPCESRCVANQLRRKHGNP
ncbi:MAG: hypothetical protein IJF33_03005 [Clostridia bacterium]|nr:hypothetical protein [Clostridia bacterium]